MKVLQTICWLMPALALMTHGAPVSSSSSSGLSNQNQNGEMAAKNEKLWRDATESMQRLQHKAYVIGKPEFLSSIETLISTMPISITNAEMNTFVQMTQAIFDYNPSRLAKILEAFKEISPDVFLQEKAFLATMAAQHKRVLLMTGILEQQEKASSLDTKRSFYQHLIKSAQSQFPEEESLERKLNPGLRSDARKWLRDGLELASKAPPRSSPRIFEKVALKKEPVQQNSLSRSFLGSGTFSTTDSKDPGYPTRESVDMDIDHEYYSQQHHEPPQPESALSSLDGFKIWETIEEAIEENGVHFDDTHPYSEGHVMPHQPRLHMEPARVPEYHALRLNAFHF
jgi:hypothetical protein